jgi:arylsulfatase A-like enzyme
LIPHVALHVPDKELEPYLKQGWEETPFVGGGGYGYTPHQTPRSAYAAMISRMDKNVGRIMALLKELNLDENTLVMFSSDNGTTMLKREVDYDFFKSVGPLRGLKADVYEGGIRVPMIARWPGKIEPGTASDLVSAFYDVMPTLCDIAGTDPSSKTDGISFAPTLFGEPQKQQKHEFLIWEFYGGQGQQAVRLGDWKGVRRQCKKDPDGPIELYNLAADIGEKQNVADRHPSIVKRIAQIMEQEHGPTELFDLRKAYQDRKKKEEAAKKR